MKSHTQSRPPSPPPVGFIIGLAAGIFVGVGLTIWLAPRVASHVRERIADSTKSIGQRASDHHERERNRFGEAVDALTTPRAL